MYRRRFNMLIAYLAANWANSSQRMCSVSLLWYGIRNVRRSACIFGSQSATDCVRCCKRMGLRALPHGWGSLFSLAALLMHNSARWPLSVLSLVPWFQTRQNGCSGKLYARWLLLRAWDLQPIGTTTTRLDKWADFSHKFGFDYSQ